MNYKKLLRDFRLFTAICLIASILLNGLSVRPELLHSNAASKYTNKRNVMYYGDWSVNHDSFFPQYIPADQLTHLNFAFLDFDSEANLVFTDKNLAVATSLGQKGISWKDACAGILPALINLKAKNPNLKIGVSLGGWTKSGDFSIVADNSELRTKLVNNTVKFMEYLDMDFIDVDWEYPGVVRQPDKVDSSGDEGTPHAREADRSNYALLLEEFRKALDQKGKENGRKYELSIALPASQYQLSVGFDIPRVFAAIDFANVMTYDLRGAWDEYSGHQTSLYSNPADPYLSSGLSIDRIVDNLLLSGAPAKKIVIGAAFYSRGWERVTVGDNPALPGLFGRASVCTKDADGSASRGAVNEADLINGDGGRRAGVWAYRSFDVLKKQYPRLTEYWDDAAKAAYMYDKSTGVFFSYDNVRSVTEKAKYVNQKGLGGIISWMASQDKASSSSSRVRNELTSAIYKEMIGKSKLPQNVSTVSERNINAKVDVVTKSGKQSFKITLTNMETSDEKDDVLKAVERIDETILRPMLYIKSKRSIVSVDKNAGKVIKKDGFVVVDLQNTANGKEIGQGQSYTFTLNTSLKSISASDIQSIELVQRTNQGGEEIRKQVLLK